VLAVVVVVVLCGGIDHAQDQKVGARGEKGREKKSEKVSPKLSARLNVMM